MNIDVERALFEHHFPPPDNVRWSEEHQSYGYIIRNSPNLTQVHRYRSMWRVWKLARTTLLIVVQEEKHE